MKISVYITSYNQKEFLIDAIESVLAQELQPFEIIIVDDFSTDGSREVIKSYANKYKKIKYFFHDKNRGVANTRITALNNVKGEYVTYVDGDDVLFPHKLKTEAELIVNSNSDLVFTNNEYVAEDNIQDVKWTWMSGNLNLNDHTNLFVKTITRDFPRGALFRMELIRYSLLKEIGFYDPNLQIYEDYDLRIRLAKKAKISYALNTTAKIRISSAGLSKMHAKEHLKAFQYIFDKYDEDIEALDEKNRAIVRDKLDQLLRNFTSSNNNFDAVRLVSKISRKVFNLLRIKI